MAGSKHTSSASKTSTVNPHESLSGLSRFFMEGLKDQAQLKKIPGEMLKQVIESKPSTTPRKGDMEAGKAVDLRSVDKKAEKPKMEVLGGIDYRREVVHGTEMIRRGESSQIEQRMQELRQEIARLASSIQAVSKEAQAIGVSQAPNEGSKYHLNFMEWMLSVVRAARMKVEDSGAWMAVSKKKNGYAQKAQNLGTKFTLSQERSTVTQTG